MARTDRERARDREYTRRIRASWTPEERAAVNAGQKKWRRHSSAAAVYFDNQLSAQGGRCDICGCRDWDSPRGFHLDHDHSIDPRGGRSFRPESYRGILCFSCNIRLVAAYEQAPERFAPHLPTVKVYIDKWKEIASKRLSAAAA